MSENRGAILARRRRFLIVALAGVGCASPPAEVPAPTESSKPSKEPLDAGTAEPEASVDTDKDGFLDEVDKCPEQPGNAEGCPRPCLMILPPEDHVEILQKIYFTPGKSKVRPQSFPILDEIATFLKERPTFVLEIAGHTHKGEPDGVAKKRAEAVRNYLVGKGVSADRLVVKEYGSTRPYDLDAQRNRRVEFHVSEK